MSKERKPTARRRDIIKTGAAGVGFLGLAGCIGLGDDDDSSSADEVVLGANHPLTGTLAFDGTRMNKAIELAVMQKNESGGIEALDGAEVKLLSGDNEAAQDAAATVTEDHVNEGADVLLGSYTSPATTAAAQIAEREQTPLVVTVAADDDAIQDGYQWTWRAQPTASVHGGAFWDKLNPMMDAAGVEVDTLATCYVDNFYGQAVSAGVEERAPDNGVEVLESQAYGFGASDLSTQALRISEADPDMVVPTTYAQGTVRLMNALDNLGWQPDYWVGAAQITFMNPELVQDIGSDATGGMSINYIHDPTNERSQEVEDRFVDEFAGEFNQELSLDGAHYMGYTAAEVAMEAIEQAGSTDPADVQAALNDIRYEDHVMAMGPIEFGDDGENINADDAVAQVYDAEEGDVRIVYPEDFAEDPPTEPFAPN